MVERLTYRFLAVTLSLIFTVFSVGIPVVLAACPMSEQEAVPSCTGCSEEQVPARESVSRYFDTTCCVTVIAADRNTTEFVGGKAIPVDSGKLPAPEPEHLSPRLTWNLTSLVTTTGSPPRSTDIPIFVSSLLI